MTSAFKKSNLYVCTCLPLIEVTLFQLFPDGATRQTLVASETKTGFCYTASLLSPYQNRHTNYEFSFFANKAIFKTFVTMKLVRI